MTRLAHWQRFDGWDDRNPAAPDVYRCCGCDAFRPVTIGFCADCGTVTGSYLWTRSDALEAHYQRALVHGLDVGFRRAACAGITDDRERRAA